LSAFTRPQYKVNRRQMSYNESGLERMMRLNKTDHMQKFRQSSDMMRKQAILEIHDIKQLLVSKGKSTFYSV